MAYVLTGQTIQLSGYFTEAYKKNLLLGEDITVRFFSLGDSDTNYFISETLNNVSDISGDNDADCIKSLSIGQNLKYELNVAPPPLPVLVLIGEEPLVRIGNQSQSFNVIINEPVGYDIPFRINAIINDLAPFNATYINRITFDGTVFSNLAELNANTFVLRAGETMLSKPIVIFFNPIPNDGLLRNIQLIVNLTAVSSTEDFNSVSTLSIERRNDFTTPITISNLTGTQGQPLVANISGTVSYPITYTIVPTSTTLTFTEGTTHTLLTNITQSGLYSVTVRDSFNNSDTKTINIENTAILSASLSYDNNGKFTVTAQNAGETIRYELFRNGIRFFFDSGLITNNNQPFIINPKIIISGNYTVRVSSAGQVATTNTITINNVIPIQTELTFNAEVRNIDKVLFTIGGVQTSSGHNIRMTRTSTNEVINIPLNFIGDFQTEISLLRCEQYTALFFEGGTNRQSNLVTFQTDCVISDVPPRNNGGGNAGCFGFGTKITMANNSVKNIEDIKVGEQVLSISIPSLPKSERFSEYSKWFVNVSEKAFNFKSAIVKDVFFNDYNFYFLINGITKVTFEHPFMVERNAKLFFLQAKDLKRGDMVFNVSGGFSKIERIERINIKLQTVNINVEPYDVYFADGLLVHNSALKEISSTV